MHFVEEKRVSVGEGKFTVNLAATITRNGIIVIILGGERPHIGAIALSIPRPSLADSSRLSATTSVLTLTGHKDDEVARPAAEKLATELNQIVVAVVGLHVEHAKKEDLKKLLANSTEAIEIFLRESGYNFEMRQS
jgi:hypothetical protein